MRLIDADALYEELRYMPYDNILEGTIDHDRPLRAIMNAPTVEMPGWISIQDRLPENRSMCLTYSPKGKMRVAEAFLPNPDDYPNDCWWSTHGQGGVHYVAVTHWMPLPEPPEEVQE